MPVTVALNVMKSIPENLALFSVISITIGFYRLYRYYIVFGIDIRSYLDFSEILQLDYLFFLLLFLVIFFVVMMLVGFTGNKIRFSDPDSISSYVKTLNNMDLYRIGIIVFAVFFCFLIVGGSISANNGRSIRAGKPEQLVNITQENKSIKSDSVLVYVGKTKNYLFLFNRKTKTSSVIKMENVKELELTPTKNFNAF